MKILIINDSLYKSSGADIYTLNLAQLLKNKGYTVKLFGYKIRKETIDSFLSRWFSIRNYLKINRIIKEFKPDIVHINGISRRISPSVILAAKKNNVYVVITIHDFHYVCPKTWGIYKNKKPCKYGFGWRCLVTNCYAQKMGIANFPYQWLKWLKVWLHRKILREYTDLFICPSKILTYWMKKSLKINNVSYIPNFIDIKTDQTQEIKKNNNQFLFVGRLNKGKGVGVLIRAIKAVKEKYPQILLKIIGNGPERKNLEKLTKKLNLQNNVNFLGKIVHKKISRYYKESLVVIIPSIWMENAPLTALEAMTHKKPLIVSNRGGLPELVKNKKNGFVFEPGSPQDLAMKITKILKNLVLVKEMGKNSELLTKTKFSKKSHFKHLDKIYRDPVSFNS